MPTFLQRLFQHRLATVGALVLLLLVFAALFAPGWRPMIRKMCIRKPALEGPVGSFLWDRTLPVAVF